MNVNRKVGTGFERDLCLSLSGCGFWAHNLAQDSQGQPFDVIAARNGVSYPIDCKDCSKNIFQDGAYRRKPVFRYDALERNQGMERAGLQLG